MNQKSHNIKKGHGVGFDAPIVAGSPVAREKRAISDLESKGYYVIFIPYNQ